MLLLKRKEDLNKQTCNKPKLLDLSHDPDDLPEEVAEIPKDPSPILEFFESKLEQLDLSLMIVPPFHQFQAGRCRVSTAKSI
jgi:hypothetical protein